VDVLLLFLRLDQLLLQTTLQVLLLKDSGAGLEKEKLGQLDLYYEEDHRVDHDQQEVWPEGYHQIGVVGGSEANELMVFNQWF
jgi:hypothetical protein